MFSEYGGSEYSPQELFVNASDAMRNIISQRHNIPPIRELKACAKYKLAKDSYEFFFPEFWRKMSFSQDGDINIAGVGVQKLSLNKSKYELL